MPKKPAKKAPKRGRPPKPAEERRDVRLNLRVTAAEKGLLEAAAARAGLSITAFILTLVRD